MKFLALMAALVIATQGATIQRHDEGIEDCDRVPKEKESHSDRMLTKYHKAAKIKKRSDKEKARSRQRRKDKERDEMLKARAAAKAIQRYEHDEDQKKARAAQPTANEAAAEIAEEYERQNLAQSQDSDSSSDGMSDDEKVQLHFLDYHESSSGDDPETPCGGCRRH